MKSLHFVSIHPEFIESYFEFGVMASARRKGISLNSVNLRDYAYDQRGSVDDVPFGGDDGMVMRPEPMRDALSSLPENSFVVLANPAAKPWKQKHCVKFARMERPIVFICGRFAGVDQRFIDKYVDEEFSMGDYIVSGGELPSLMMADGILRECEGVLGNRVSAERDSFGGAYEGLLEPPSYTRPREFEGLSVPEVLFSGDHKRIHNWKMKQSYERTRTLRPDLLDGRI